MFLKITRDDISPVLSNLARTARNPRPVLLAMGNIFKSITEGTFNSVGASFRPIPWVNKKDGTPSNLQASTTLSKSFHLEVTDTYAKLSNATIYAAIHQFGGVIEPKNGKMLSWVGSDGKRYFTKRVVMPARPFFPIRDGKLTPEAEEKIRLAGESAVRRQSGS